MIEPGLDDLHLAGLTRVHPLLPGSPAMNAGDNDLSLGRVADQRGQPFIRIFDTNIERKDRKDATCVCDLQFTGCNLMISLPGEFKSLLRIVSQDVLWNRILCTKSSKGK